MGEALNDSSQCSVRVCGCFGSVQPAWKAQRLIFQYSDKGDLTPHIAAYFDPKAAQAELVARSRNPIPCTPVGPSTQNLHGSNPSGSAVNMLRVLKPESRYPTGQRPKPPQAHSSPSAEVLLSSPWEASKQEAKAYTEIALSLGIDSSQGASRGRSPE